MLRKKRTLTAQKGSVATTSEEVVLPLSSAAEGNEYSSDKESMDIVNVEGGNAASARCPLLSIRDLSKSYADHQVLDGVSLEVYPGEIVGIIGKNGAGKSTLIETALGLRADDSGTVLINGIDISVESVKAKQLIGYVPSEPIAYDSMTGSEYLAYTAAIYGMDRGESQRDAERLLKELSLPSSMYNRPFALCSHGTQQKICLAASLIHRPRVWILDEPTVGLDAIAYRSLLKIMREYADRGNSIVMVSHDMDLVKSICDQVFVLKGAHLYREDEVEGKDLISEIQEELE